MNPDAYQVISDLYNRWFAVQTSNPELLVDYVVWNQIVSALPKDYVLPDPLIYNIG
ncbi:zinc finger (CCCH type) protein, putative [Paenibacillus algicola]|uniref:Zinc finger (CCCH type) protein, putative n=1 Tax=Paenibacillus algicola TaxID=2565926 RepID=A0A4P8XJP0_9BACL|nr:hypothetical protein [Paenibacillus algicola]QCT02856.1 zinc finger (CCCH type) protein, putative [Paenibacillus algicola]